MTLLLMDILLSSNSISGYVVANGVGNGVGRTLDAYVQICLGLLECRKSAYGLSLFPRSVAGVNLEETVDEFLSLSHRKLEGFRVPTTITA